MPRQWEPLVAEFSDVMKLVHLAMRRDTTDIASIANELFKEKRQAYEDGLTTQAANAGCSGRKGVMPNDELTMARDEANSEAASIANTYNYDLAVAIRHIRTETPGANRHVYAKRLLEWEETRDEWKSQQIALWNQTKWTNIALQDFLAHNPQLNNGYAILKPERTVCEFCQKWAKRGKVPMAEAVRVEFPAHINCPHYWETHYKGKVKCDELWMGADVKQWWEDIEAGKELGEKGGPGSGNFGHSGRPGLVGGSASGTGGRIYNAGAYLYTKRSGAMAKGIIGDVRNQIASAHPNLQEHEVQGYLDVMSLDEERYNHYAAKLGVTIPAKEYFEQIKQIDREQARLRWEVQEEASLKDADGRVHHWATIDDDLYNRLEAVRIGNAYDAAADALRQYGVEVRIGRPNTVPGEIHSGLSILATFANENPVFAQVLRDQVRRIEFVDRPAGVTSVAQYDPTSHSIRVYPNNMMVSPSTYIHEVGHGAEGYVPTESTTLHDFVSLSRGRQVSVYASKNYQESFAETFTMLIGGRRAEATAWCPDKVEFLDRVVPGLAGVQ